MPLIASWLHFVDANRLTFMMFTLGIACGMGLCRLALNRADNRRERSTDTSVSFDSNRSDPQDGATLIYEDHIERITPQVSQRPRVPHIVQIQPSAMNR